MSSVDTEGRTEALPVYTGTAYVVPEATPEFVREHFQGEALATLISLGLALLVGLAIKLGLFLAPR
jgi:hypothetical protein